MPRFDIGTKVELSSVMAELGMPTAFDPNRADFSAMTKEAELFIGLIVQRLRRTRNSDTPTATPAS